MSFFSQDTKNTAKRKTRSSIITWLGQLSPKGTSSNEITNLNTGTIHMFAIACLSDAMQEGQVHTVRKEVKLWISSIFSFLVMILQLTVLAYVMNESSLPTCTTHTDCSTGNYCDGYAAVQPR